MPVHKNVVKKCAPALSEFKVKVLDIEAGQNEIVLNESDAQCMDLDILDRVKLNFGRSEETAIVDFSHGFVKSGEIEMFLEVAEKLGVKTGDSIKITPTNRPESLDFIRKKLDGKTLTPSEINSIINDLMKEHLSNAELAAFISAVYINDMNMDEIAALTNAIYESGDRLDFPKNQIVITEHSIGGIAGDRVSVLIVPILASLGLTVPKTCTRAISSAAGTADTLEVICPVSLTLDEIKSTLKKTGCCLVWGGAVNMAVADDKLIKIRNPLHLDPKSLLLSSILAKKKAEGATHFILDIPVGRGAKIDDVKKGKELALDFQNLGTKIGMKVQVLITDGSEPVCMDIGPALEARAIIHAFTKGDGMLVQKACTIAGSALALLKGIRKEEGYMIAMHQFTNGKAYAKFKEMVAAQGGNPEIKEEDIPIGNITYEFRSDSDGKVDHIDNKAISRVARALGAPSDKQAGLSIKVGLGSQVKKGDLLYVMYTSSNSKLEYAKEQAKVHQVVEIEKIIIDTI